MTTSGRRPGPRVGWWLLFATAIVAAGSHLGTRGNTDVTWYLYAAREVLHGARYGTDILELNPPFIVWLKIPAVAAAGLLGIREWSAWVVEVTALACAAITFARALLPQGTSAGATGIAGISVGAASLLLLPGGDFGQREHVAVILALPYVVLVARRLAGDPVPLRSAAVAGVLGGLGFVIKPYLVLVPVVILAFEIRRLGLRKTLLPEHGVALAVGVLYFGTLPWTAPGFLEQAPTLWALYREYLPRPLWESALFSGGILPGYMALAAYLALRPRIRPRAVPLADALAIATLAFQLTGILQGKGWRYYFVPAQACAVLLGVTLAAGSWGFLRRPLERVYHALMVGMLAAMAGSAVPEAGIRLANPLDPRLTADQDLDRLLPLVEASGSHGGVAVLSTALESSFPLVLEGKSQWAFRYPSLWPLVVLYRDQVQHHQLVLPRPFGERDALEREFSLGVVESLRRARPALLLVLGASPEVPRAGVARLFDYLDYYSAEPGFGEFLAQYEDAGAVGSYRVYRRADWELPEDTIDQARGAPAHEPAAWPPEGLGFGLLIAGMIAGAGASVVLARAKTIDPA